MEPQGFPQYFLRSCFKVCADIWNCDRLGRSFTHSLVNLPSTAQSRLPFIIKVLSVRIRFFSKHHTFCDIVEMRKMWCEYWIWILTEAWVCLLCIVCLIRQGLVLRPAKCLPPPFMWKSLEGPQAPGSCSCVINVFLANFYGMFTFCFVKRDDSRLAICTSLGKCSCIF